MLQNIKQSILNKLNRQDSLGFMVESLDCNQVSGWIIPKEGNNPDELRFQLVEKGRDISLSVHLFHRAAFASQSSQNLYGFRIRFSQQVAEFSKTSFFYIDDKDRIEPRLLPKAAWTFAKPSGSIYFLNCMMSQIQINSEPLPSQDVLELLTSGTSKSSKDIETTMTECLCDDLAMFNLQVGLKSKCGVAITGKSGHLFLHGGDNKVDELFQQTDVYLDKAPVWFSLFLNRKKRACLSDYQYLQIVIPEKQTLLGNFYYRNNIVPSKLLERLEKADRQTYFSVWEALSNYSAEDLFFKTDSHLSAKGTFYLFKELIEHLGFNISVEPKFNITQHKSGDLGRKYTPFTFWEKYQVTADVPILDRQIKYKFEPEKKGHMGKHIYWINPSAPFNKKVLIFGNSFCDMGTQQHHLTWWFSHYFKECQFVWSGDFNDKLIEMFKPDIVIGQSTERFLRLVPRF